MTDLTHAADTIDAAPADERWRRTRAALDGDGGVPIYQRAALAPIEDDALDARDQARRAAEDEARERWDQW